MPCRIVCLFLFVICVWQSFLLFNSCNTTKVASNVITTKISNASNSMVYAEENISETIRFFSSMDSMRTSQELKAGMAVQTMGYYKVNDGGAALYNIRSRKSSDMEDGGSVIFLTNGNVAELITDGSVNVKKFGAVGDGVTDDTIAIKKAIDFGLPVFFPKGKFMVNETLVLDHRTIGHCKAAASLGEMKLL